MSRDTHLSFQCLWVRVTSHPAQLRVICLDSSACVFVYMDMSECLLYVSHLSATHGCGLCICWGGHSMEQASKCAPSAGFLQRDLFALRTPASESYAQAVPAHPQGSERARFLVPGPGV